MLYLFIEVEEIEMSSKTLKYVVELNIPLNLAETD
jgi:hypothetical protein